MYKEDKFKQLKIIFRNRPFQYLAVILGVILIYKIHIWINTESTDNAYVKGEITLISSEINGRVIEVLVHDNMPVKKGDILARIDDTSYKAALEQSELKLKAAEYAILITDQKLIMEQTNFENVSEALKLAEINFSLAERDYKRNFALSKDQFSSQKSLDTSKSAFEQARTALAQAKLAVQTSQENTEMLTLQKKLNSSDVEAAKQSRIIAEKDIQNTVIVSPIDGTSAGSGLRVGNFLTIGTPLIYIVPRDMYIVANFKETQVAHFKEGQEVAIKFDAINGKYNGKIRNISPASGSTFSLIPVDNATGNFTKIVQRVPVIIDFDNAAEGLENLGVGMSTSVNVDVR